MSALAMIWAVPAPDLAPITLNLQPLVGVVEDVGDQSTAGKLKRLADDLERDVAERRAEFAATMRAIMTMVARAELDGWELDVNDPIKGLEAWVAKIRLALGSLKKTLRGFVARMHAARIPGANTLRNSERKILESFDSFANDFDDYLADLAAVRERMRLYKKVTPPITKAEIAYKRAFGKIFEADLGIMSRGDDIDGMLTVRICVPVVRELLANPSELLRREAKVHDEVALQDSTLVGKIAVDYVAVD